jgi:hypothetical protein
VRAALRLAIVNSASRLALWLDVLGLPVGGAAEVVGRLLRVDERGPDRTLEVLELLQAVLRLETSSRIRWFSV